MLSSFGGSISASKNSTVASSRRGFRPRSNRLYSSDATEGHSDLNLMDYGHNASRGYVKSMPRMEDATRETKGIKKTEEVTITRQPV